MKGALSLLPAGYPAITFASTFLHGTGLGVPQVSALLHMVGGHMRVASEPGAGTTVDLYFPATDAH